MKHNDIIITKNIPEKYLISIITPLYNAQKYLKEYIDSVLAQSYSKWELIIINDGSTDNSKRIIAEYINDSRIKYFEIENSGVSKARNHGIEKSTGDYIFFMDADDILPENSLEILVTYVIEHHSDIVLGNAKILDEQLIAPPLLHSANLITSPQLIKDIQHNKASTSVWGKLFSKKSLQNIRFFPGLNRGEDVMFLYDVLLSNFHLKIYRSTDFTYIYRKSQQSLSTYDYKKNNKILENYISHLLALYDLFVKHKDRVLKQFGKIDANGIGAYLFMYLQYQEESQRILPPEYQKIYYEIKEYLTGKLKKHLLNYEKLPSKKFDSYLNRLLFRSKIKRYYDLTFGKVLYKLNIIFFQIAKLLNKSGKKRFNE